MAETPVAAAELDSAPAKPPGPGLVAPGPEPEIGAKSRNQEDAPPTAAELETTRLPELYRLHLEPVDYNAPDPERNGYNWARAVAGVGTANYLVWQFNWFVGEDWAYVTREAWKNNLRQGFEWDDNKLPTNFFSHPYHGSVYFNVGRSSGLSFWESTSMAFLGSLGWELVGESDVPSTNDLIATSMGGIVLGEILYRLSSELLDDSSSSFERVLREMLAGLINPGRGIQRLVDGKAWSSGPPPDRSNVVKTAVEGGVDRIRLWHDRSVAPYEPLPLLALKIEYGDFLPREGTRRLEPFEAFDFYAALNLGSARDLGAQISSQGMLLGYSSDVGQDRGEFRDNNVIGLVQSFDFRGARVAKFGGMGIGPGDTLVLRYGRDRRLRLSADIQWLVLGAVSSPLDGPRDSGYNFLTGVSAGQQVRLDMARWGEIGWGSKQHAGVVIDGEPGEEFVGHARLWYEVDVVKSLGVGVSPDLVHRISHFDSVGWIWSVQLETQVYALGHF